MDRDQSFYWLVINSAANIPLNSYRNWKPLKNADGSLNYANPNNYYNDYYNNPWFYLDNNRLDRTDDFLTANAELNYKVAPWLNATYRIATTNQSTFSKAYSDKFDYSSWATDSVGRSVAKDYAGYVRDVSSNSTRISQDLFLTAKKKWTNFSVLGIVGMNLFDNSTKYSSVAATGLVIPGLFNVNNRIGEAVVDEENTKTRRVGVFGDVTIGFKDYLFLHASGRNDWDSRLAKENNSFFYPSVDLSFVLSDAIGALKDNKTLTYAKLTAAATKVGNVNLGAYNLETVFNGGAGFPYGDLAGFSVGNTQYDPKLKPEFTTSYEFGIELGFLERLNLELAYYTQKTTDQTVNIAISNSTGFTGAVINTGQVDNSGFEATLRGTVLKTENFRWDVSMNYAYRDNKVASLYQGLDEIALSNVDADGTIAAIAGEQYPALKVSSYKRDPQGRVIVDPVTGYPIEATGFTNVGQTNPKHLVGIQTSFSYKGFSLSALAEYRAGNVIYHATGHNLVFTGVAEVTAMYNRERFVFPNSVTEVTDTNGNVIDYQPNTNIAVQDGGLGFWDDHFDGVGENFVTSGAFWKLREVNLTYTLPESFLEKSKIFKGASVSFIGRNLLMLLPKANKYTDPELSTTTGNAQGANNIFNTPPTRMYGFNVTLNF
ncbi:MAG: TonB-dependent receptor [Thermonemataceae bacterium]|nr:TonB-dependent receptor [Thermonemataceae bacterium]